MIRAGRYTILIIYVQTVKSAYLECTQEPFLVSDKFGVRKHAIDAYVQLSIDYSQILGLPIEGPLTRFGG